MGAGGPILSAGGRPLNTYASPAAPPLLAVVLVLILGIAVLLAVLRLFRISDDVRKIREHLDRVVPDVIKANKARVRDQLGHEPEPGRR